MEKVSKYPTLKLIQILNKINFKSYKMIVKAIDIMMDNNYNPNNHNISNHNISNHNH